MAKARARTTTARKVKDRWKSKNWYNVLAPPSFDNATIAETLADTSESLIDRITGVSLQDMTNDFRKSHITLFFRINKVEGTNAHTEFIGHTLTSDYLRRMIRRRKSKIDGVYDVTTRDQAVLRVKPFATTDKRIQSSQKKVIREAMKKTIFDQAKTNVMSDFIKIILDGRMGSEIYKNCKKLYPVKRIEIYKTAVVSQPTIVIEEKKPKKEEKEKVEEPAKKEKKEEETKEPKTREELKTEEIPKEKAVQENLEKPEKKSKKTAVKKSGKTTTPKKTKTKKKTTKKEE
ncbi:MAG: 30S ribosomal protein S3ae [Euryarchaeota archaeon RBG_13_31_8]|nr:MAG: 30S ribosomal protein S3ae [Euryarchaeota archaeon RBG_13_31_8]